MTTTKNTTTGTALTVAQAEEFTDGMMTPSEAEAHTERIMQSADATRWLLLEAFERKAHKALGYGSFEDYAKKRLNMPIVAENLSRMVRWAETERNVLKLPKTYHNDNFSDSTGSQRPKLTWAIAEQLTKLPSPQMQLDAFEQMEGLKAHGATTPGEQLRNLKNIVARMAPKTPKAASPKSAPNTGNSPNAATDAPNAFEQAVQERQPSAPAKESGESAKVPPASKSAAASFTTAPDPSFDDEPAANATAPFDFVHAKNTLHTLLAWITNGQVDGERKNAQLVVASLDEIAQWVEQQI